MPPAGIYLEDCKHVDYGYFGNLKVFSREGCFETKRCDVVGYNCFTTKPAQTSWAWFGGAVPWFMVILAGFVDQRNKLQNEIETLESDCAEVRHIYEYSISAAETQIKEEQSNLAVATKRERSQKATRS